MIYEWMKNPVGLRTQMNCVKNNIGENGKSTKEASRNIFDLSSQAVLALSFVDLHVYLAVGF